MSEDNNIPKHWGRTKASEVGKLLRGINYKKQDASNEAKKDFLPVLRGNNINGELNFEDLVFVPKQNVSNEQLIKAGDIVFAMSSGSKHLVGKSAKAKTDYNGSFGAFCGVFRPNENFDKNFVAYFFQSPYYKKVISEISKGTNINNLKREHILDLDFPIPPLPEQQAIVAKIEELLSDLENGKQQLQTAQQQLKVYRQSLLKWAFEGKLTKTKMGSAKLIEHCELITKGASPRWQGFEYISDETQLLFVTSENVRDNYIDVEEPKYLKLEFNNIQKRSILKKGDVLFNLVGASIGRAAVFNFDKISNINQAVAVIRLKQTLNNKYISFFLNSEVAKHKYLANVVDVARANLSLTDTNNIEIPYCSSEEQQLIVDELESKLTVCDKIEETISHSLQQAETLRQSILKKAFEGKLIKE